MGVERRLPGRREQHDEGNIGLSESWGRLAVSRAPGHALEVDRVPGDALTVALETDTFFPLYGSSVCQPPGRMR